MVQKQHIIWDKGSAYDLFVSLWIIHQPDEFGLRPSWAAGVRSRLPIHLRNVLELSMKFLNVPLHWIYNLPAPKDAATALVVLESLPPEDRLPALVFATKDDEESTQNMAFLLSLDGKQRLTASIEKRILNQFRTASQVRKERIRATFEAWADRKAFGELFLEGMKAYVENFYQEEELRIIPAQDTALEDARALAEEKDPLTFLEIQSTGVRMDWIMEVSTLILAPSFWGAPFMFFNALSKETGIILFGARPKGMALVPGELVPEDLLNALKALADPTRLRILRYLVEGPTTPNELARILRLRPPTVIHHLNNLRLAGLVRVTVSPQEERRYAVRLDGIDTTVDCLHEFLSGD